MRLVGFTAERAWSFKFEFLQLRANNNRAIGSRRIVPVVVLVIVLRFIELRQCLDFCDDRIPEFSPSFGSRCLSSSPLFVIVMKDDRSVLCPHISALTIQRRRIVTLPEHVKQLLIRNYRGVKCDLGNLGVAGLCSAHLFVRWERFRPPSVSCNHIVKSGQSLKDSFNAPETSGTESRFVQLRHRGPFLSKES